MRLLITCLLLTAAPAAAQDAALAPDDPLYREILQLEEDRNAAHARGDTVALASAFAAEYVHTNLRGGVTTKAQELAFYGDPAFTL